MRRTLPPLTTLRPFESAARLGSFSAAAEELALTQGAVSLQIRNLEDFLGRKLFERKVRKVVLTDDGREYYETCRRALEELERVTRRMQGQDGHTIVTVSALPTIATMWLMPKLSDFSSTYPDIEVRVVTSIAPVDLRGSDADIALRVGRLPGKHYPRGLPGIDLVMTEHWEGVVADYLFDDVLVPVISRKLLDQGARIEQPRDVLKYSLIHTASRRNAWRDWLRAHDVPEEKHRSPVEYGHFFMAAKAALDCKGIAIIPHKLFETYRHRSNDLIAPLAPDVPSAGEYYMLTHESRIDSPAIRILRKWILLMADAERPLTA